MQTQELTKTTMLQGKGWVGYGLYAIAGAAVGFFSGMFGVGGGILMVPFLLLVAGYTQQQSQGISLAAMIVTAAAGALNNYRLGVLTPAMLPVALALAIGSVPGTSYGTALAKRLPNNALSALFAMFIVAMAVRIMPPDGARQLHLPLSGVFPSLLILVGVLVLAIGIRMAFTR